MRDKIKKVLDQYKDHEGNPVMTLAEFLEECLAAYDPSVKLEVG